MEENGIPEDLASASSSTVRHFAKPQRKRGRPKYKMSRWISRFFFDVIFADGSIRRDVPFSALRPLVSTADALKALEISREAVSKKLTAVGGIASLADPARRTIVEDAVCVSAASLLRQATVMESCRLRRVSLVGVHDLLSG